MADQWFHLTGDRIDGSLDAEYRQYFVGNLSRPQVIEHIEAEGLEFGTSLYQEFTADHPHLHTDSLECIYVLQGSYTILLIDTGEEVVLGPGDFFALRRGNAYASKTNGARVIFVKAPGDDDKVEVEVDDATAAWLATPGDDARRSGTPGQPTPGASGAEAAESKPGPWRPEDVTSMYAIYQSEWEHRDSVLWSTAFRLFFTSLLIALLPYLEGYFAVDMPFPAWIFVAASILLTGYFFVVTLAYGERLAAAGATLARLQLKLDPGLQRVAVGANLPGTRMPLVGKLVRLHIAWWTPILMASFLVLVNVAVVLGVYVL